MRDSNGSGTALATAPTHVETSAVKRRPPTLQGLLESRRSAMEAVLPKHLDAERLIKIALVAISKTPKLMDCSHESILQSVMTAAQLGLDCGGVLGSAYLVPFKKNKKDGGGNWSSTMECQLIIGYRGMIDLARRSGQISSIEARVVYTNDFFELEYGMETKLVHRPALDQDPGAFRLVYAVARLKDGSTQFEIMTKAAVDAIRARSMAKDNGPWVTDYTEMARKTVVKRIFKYLPVSIEMAEAVQNETHGEFGQDFNLTSAANLSTGPTDDLNRRLESRSSSKQLIDPADELRRLEEAEEANTDRDTGEVKGESQVEADLRSESHNEPAGPDLDDQSQSAPTGEETQDAPPNPAKFGKTEIIHWVFEQILAKHPDADKAAVDAHAKSLVIGTSREWKKLTADERELYVKTWIGQQFKWPPKA